MDRNRLRKALDILTTGAKAKRAGRDKDAAQRAHEDALAWISQPTVRGLGIGRNEVGGATQDTLVIKVYVEHKLADSEVEIPIPREIRLPGIDDPVPTDVVELGPLDPQRADVVFPDRQRPARPGVSISASAQHNTGTLGCLVTARDGAARRYILSSAHVIADLGRATPGGPIFQPSRDFSSDPADAIADLTAFAPIVSTATAFPNQVDAAIARVRSPGDVNPVILIREQPPGRIRNIVRAGDKVQMTGCVSGRTEGRVTDIDFHWEFRHPDPRIGDRYGFSNLVLCTSFTRGGDSGAAVVSSTGRMLGIVFAGNSRFTIFNRIRPICDALEVDIVTDRD